MRDSVWLFPMAEILHFMGLSLLIGSLLVVDFRLLGFARNFPVAAVYRFLPVALAGFGINLVTGAMFFFSDPFPLLPQYRFPAEDAVHSPGRAERAVLRPDRTQAYHRRPGGGRQDGVRIVFSVLDRGYYPGAVYSLRGMIDGVRVKILRISYSDPCLLRLGGKALVLTISPATAGDAGHTLFPASL